MVRDWMLAAGMKVQTDAVGNLHGHYQGACADAPNLVIASHLDSVPNAGKYDGILGVLLGIALVEGLSGTRLPFSIEVIGFSDEEGVRYGVPFIGSRSIVGTLDASCLNLIDVNGISLDAALRGFAETHPETVPAALDPRTTAYLEFHIEQGPVLDKANLPLAIVEAIAGQSRATLTFQGRAAHAGTTPMTMRQDALLASAEWLMAVEAAASETPGLVATTGRIHCAPGAANTIPGVVSCSLDVRSSSDASRSHSLGLMLNTAKEIGKRRRVKVSFAIESDQPTVPLHPSLTRFAEHTLSKADVPATRMTSGAGHDAMIVAPHCPATMIFVRSPGGISHHPDESVLMHDISTALRAGAYFLDGFMGWLESEEQPCNQ